MNPITRLVRIAWAHVRCNAYCVYRLLSEGWPTKDGVLFFGTMTLNGRTVLIAAIAKVGPSMPASAELVLREEYYVVKPFFDDPARHYFQAV